MHPYYSNGTLHTIRDIIHIPFQNVNEILNKQLIVRMDLILQQKMWSGRQGQTGLCPVDFLFPVGSHTTGVHASDITTEGERERERESSLAYSPACINTSHKAQHISFEVSYAVML